MYLTLITCEIVLFFHIYSLPFILQHLVCVSCSVPSNSLRPHGLQLARLLCPWNSPSKNTRVGYHSLLQGTILTQIFNTGLPNFRQILYHLSQQGGPEEYIFPFLKSLTLCLAK